MSWLNNLSDLAGKAEHLLNNIDQSAAVAILKAKDNADGSEEPAVHPDISQSEPLNAKGETAPKPATLSEATKSPNVKFPGKKREVPRTKDTTSDDALFKFLNSDKKATKTRTPSMTPVNKKTVAKPPSGTSSVSNSPVKLNFDKNEVQGAAPPVPASLEISRSSSFESDHLKLNTKVPADSGSSSSEPHETISEADVMTLPTDSTASESEFEMVGSTAAASSDRDTPESGEAVLPTVSSKRDLAVENRLLKNEMSSLHQELTHMNSRNMKMKTDYQSSNSEIRSRCDDLTEELKVKSSQLVALQMKLRESENLLIMEQENSEKLQNNLDRIRLDQSEGSEMHGRAIDELRLRLEETEHNLAMEKRAHSETRQEVLQNKTRQDSEAKKIAESYQKSERDRQFEKKRLDQLTAETRTLKSNLSSSKQELADYKQKAARILQSKERLITSLKGTGEVEMTSSTIASLELEELRQDRDVAKEENTSLRIEIQNLRAEFQDTEQQYQQENSSLAQEVNDLRSRIDEDSRSHREVQSELVRLQEEMRQDRDEATRSRSSMQARLKDKEMEIDRLRNQLMIKSQSSPQESELESRLRQLTETVIQKQAIVETLSAEKNSLLVQMERMEGQIKTLKQEGNHVRLNVDADHSNHQSNTSYVPEFSINGSEQGVVGKVRKAASALDRFSIRLGVFLKRYPPARLFLIFYMFLLHVWVMIVLLTYTPEVHGQDFVGPRRTDLMVGC